MITKLLFGVAIGLELYAGFLFHVAISKPIVAFIISLF